jgi:hypothetical protein
MVALIYLFPRIRIGTSKRVKNFKFINLQPITNQ